MRLSSEVALVGTVTYIAMPSAFRIFPDRHSPESPLDFPVPLGGENDPRGKLQKVANFAQLPLVAPPIISANQAAVEEIMERYAELMQRLLEVLSGGRPRSSKLMEGR